MGSGVRTVSRTDWERSRLANSAKEIGSSFFGGGERATGSAAALTISCSVIPVDVTAPPPDKGSLYKSFILVLGGSARPDVIDPGH